MGLWITHSHARGGRPSLDRPHTKTLIMNRETFLSDTLHHLTDALQAVAGLEETEALLASAGASMGERIHAKECTLLKVDRLPIASLPASFGTLAEGFGAVFHSDDSQATKFIMENCTCQRNCEQRSRRGYCNLMANILGSFAANSAGYAKVRLERLTSHPQGCCRMVIDLEDDGSPGIEYFAHD